MKESSGQSMNLHNNHPFRIFILADKEVLAMPELPMIKIVASNYNAPDTVPYNWKSGPKRYFGRTTMLVQDILYLLRKMVSGRTTERLTSPE